MVVDTLEPVLEPCADRKPARHRTVVSIIVPTRNEAANVSRLVTRVTDALRDLGEAWEILFVDDSDDATPEVIASLAQTGHPVRLVHRYAGARAGGLSGAVLEGFATSDSPVFVVMDADLQHPPELIPQLVAPILSDAAEVVVATRYAGDGTAAGLDGAGRRAISSGSRRVVQLLMPRARAVSDPLGGFFAVRWDVLDGVSLQPQGFKILLEILTRGRWRRVEEVPYEFAEREGGESKASFREGVRFAGHLASLVGPAPTTAPPTPQRRLAGLASSAPARIALALVLVVAAYWYSLGSLVSAWDPADARSVACVVPVIAALLLLAVARPAVDEPAIHDRQVDYLLGIAALAAAIFMLVMLPRRMDVAFWVERLDLLSLPLFVAGLVFVLFGTRALWRVRWALLFMVLVWPVMTRTAAARVSGPLASTSRAAVGSITDALGLARGASATSSTATMVLLAVVAGFALVIWARPRPMRAVVVIAILAVAAWCANVARLTTARAVGASHDAVASRAILGSAGFLVTATLVVVVTARLLFVGRGPQPTHRRSISPRRSPAVLRPGLAVGLVGAVAVAAGIVTAGYVRYDAVVGPLGDARVEPLGTRQLAVPGYLAVAERHAGRSSAGRHRFEFEPEDAAPGSPPLVVDSFAVGDPGDGTVASLRGAYPLNGAVLVSRRSVGLGAGGDGDLVVFRRARQTWTALSWVWPVHDGTRETYERIVVADRVLQSATATVTARGGDGAGPDAADATTLRRFATGVVRAELSGSSSRLDRADGGR